MSNILKLKDVIKLKSIPLPKKTKSYTPISHCEIINNIEQQAPLHWKPKGYKIILKNNGKELFGTVDFDNKLVTNDLITIGFRNSYNKNISMGICAGTKVIVCSNLMFIGDIIKIRRHTLNIKIDLKRIITETIIHAESSAKQLQKDMKQLESVKINNKDAAKIIGEAFFNRNILSSQQVNKIKKEWNNGNYSKIHGLNEKCKKRTLYSLYQACTDALKSSTTNRMLENHINLHTYFVSLN